MENFMQKVWPASAAARDNFLTSLDLPVAVVEL
jgi:hypothetical protein